jgi:hypothetical protein
MALSRFEFPPLIEIGGFEIDRIYGEAHFLQKERKVAIRSSNVCDPSAESTAQFRQVKSASGQKLINGFKDFSVSGRGTKMTWDAERV